MPALYDRPDVGGDGARTGSDPRVPPARGDRATRGNAVAAGVLLILATAANLLSQPFLAPATGEDVLTSAAAHQGQIGVGC